MTGTGTAIFLGLLSAQARAGAFVGIEWRGYAMASHLSTGPAASVGASLWDDHVRIGLAGTARPGPINPATFPLALDDGETYRGQEVIYLRSDGGVTGLHLAVGAPLRGGRWHLSAPLLVGYGGYGFYLTGEDRETPDGQKPSVWEDRLLAGQDSAFGVGVDGGVQLALGAQRAVRPTLAVRYHAILGYDATYTDRYAGPSVSLGIEVVP